MIPGRFWFYACVNCFFLWATDANAQAQNLPAKEINHQLQTWVSVNSLFRFSNRWGALADVHIRRTDFVKDPSFYFIRLGANYWIKENMTAAFGYGHLWVAPPREDWTVWVNENRMYQQFLFNATSGKTGITHRFRNEQRWFQVVENNQRTGKTRFTNRFRYLLSANFRVFRKPGAPMLVLSDEILLNFGKAAVFNTFDQNRLFVGFIKKINPSWAVDFGYMNVYQQRFSGYQYDMNHTIRLFFYYNRKWKKPQRPVPEHHDE